MSKRSFNKRQMAIIELIRSRKAEGAEIITLNEILQLCLDKNLLPRVSEASERPTVLCNNELPCQAFTEFWHINNQGRQYWSECKKCEFLI